MFYLNMYFMSILCATTFIFMIHPLAMGFMLLIQTILICLLSGLMMKTFWFSYILFLIFVGGMLILFIYVTSLASNEMFNFSMKDFLLKIYILLTYFFIMIINDKLMFLNYFMNFEMDMLIDEKTFLLENTLNLNKLFNYPINLISIMLMIYLFFTLIAAVKITNIFEGPLRPKTSM